MKRNCICSPLQIKERNGHSASCNRSERNRETNELKLKKIKKPIAKVGTNNTFKTSHGLSHNQEFINDIRNAVYELIDEKREERCEGCGQPANCHAHIIAQARCKLLHKTELIWDIDNIFRSCFACNAAIENPKGQEWKQLKNIDKCLKFIEQNDPELWVKFQLNGSKSQFTEPHAI